jgi:hypothetical protein
MWSGRAYIGRRFKAFDSCFPKWSANQMFELMMKDQTAKKKKTPAVRKGRRG